MCAHPLDGAFERVIRAGEHIDTLTAAINKSTRGLEQAVLDGLDLTNLKFTLESPYLPLSPHVQPSLSVPPRWAVLVGETSSLSKIQAPRSTIRSFRLRSH